MRQARNTGALHETHRQVDDQQEFAPEPSASRSPRNYGALQETQHQIDDRNSLAKRASALFRSWTHHGGMVEHHASANEWIRQNHEIRTKMAANDKSGPGREGEGAQSPQSNREQDQAELQEARAAVEEARRREGAERARQQEHDRSGPER